MGVDRAVRAGVVVMVLMGACKRAEEPREPTRTTPTVTTFPTTDSEELPPDSSPPTAPSTATTGDTGPELDCSVLPPVPAPFITMNQYDTSEDFDFDGSGYLCTVLNQNLACRDQSGDQRLVSPNIAATTAGTRVLPTGDWVVAAPSNETLILIDGVTGGQTVLASGLQYPNGVEVDADNMVYVAEHNAGRVRQIDAYTGEQWPVANGMTAPNGVILSPDGNTLYVGSFGGGLIYAVDRLGPHEWDQWRVLFDPASGDGGFDGINVDACGNVYITEYTTGRIYRITPDGSQTDIVVDLPSGWIPNLRWGPDIGGWRSDILYVAAWTRVYALDMQIPGKPHVFAAP